MHLKCYVNFHEWDGCKCLRCGKYRDEGHDWSQDCDKCTKCGKTRSDRHSWDGYKCTSCGKTRILDIITLEDLQAVSTDLCGYYRLAADIDAAPTRNWDHGKGFKPIGDEDNRFRGVLDGDGHIIRNLYINRPKENYVGLIGYLASEQGEVRNLSLVNANVSGNKYVGGLVGMNNSGTVTGCHVSGKISGESAIGGLVGCCMGSIMQCRVPGKVSGHNRIGGLVGSNTQGKIVECYASGKVSGTRETYEIGGLVGADYMGIFSKCYWDIQTTGQRASPGGTGKTSKEMKSLGTFSGWDFENVWQIEEGCGYPILRRFARRKDFSETAIVSPEISVGEGK
jgi:hypothetical protein